MMDNNDDPAPPPYSHQELDSKVNLAIQASLHVDEHPAPPPHPQHILPEPVRSYYQQRLASSQNESTPARRPLPAAPSAASTQLQQNAYLTPDPALTPSVPPPPKASTPKPKEKPSWLQEAGLGDAASSSTSENSASVPVAAGSSSPPPPVDPLQSPPPAVTVGSLTSPLDTSSPPPFSYQGPSLDGPVYQEYDQQSLGIISSIEQSSPQSSRAPSPGLTETETDSSSRMSMVSEPDYRANHLRHHHQSMPPPVAQNPHVPHNPRHMSVFVRPPPPLPPSLPVKQPIQFSMNFAHTAATQPAPAVDPSAFYNSSIASAIRPQVSQQPWTRPPPPPPLPQNVPRPAMMQYQYPQSQGAPMPPTNAPNFYSSQFSNMPNVPAPPTHVGPYYAGPVGPPPGQYYTQGAAAHRPY